MAEPSERYKRMRKELTRTAQRLEHRNITNAAEITARYDLALRTMDLYVAFLELRCDTLRAMSTAVFNAKQNDGALWEKAKPALIALQEVDDRLLHEMAAAQKASASPPAPDGEGGAGK